MAFTSLSEGIRPRAAQAHDRGATVWRITSVSAVVARDSASSAASAARSTSVTVASPPYARSRMMRCDSRACIRAARRPLLSRAAASCASRRARPLRCGAPRVRARRSRGRARAASVTRAAILRKMFTHSLPTARSGRRNLAVGTSRTGDSGQRGEAASPVLGELEMDMACRSCGCLVSLPGRGRLRRRSLARRPDRNPTTVSGKPTAGSCGQSDREVSGRCDLPLAHVRQVHVDREDIPSVTRPTSRRARVGDRSPPLPCVRGSHRRLELQNAHERLRCSEAQVLPRSVPGRRGHVALQGRRPPEPRQASVVERLLSATAVRVLVSGSG